MVPKEKKNTIGEQLAAKLFENKKSYQARRMSSGNAFQDFVVSWINHWKHDRWFSGSKTSDEFRRMLCVPSRSVSVRLVI